MSSWKLTLITENFIDTNLLLQTSSAILPQQIYPQTFQLRDCWMHTELIPEEIWKKEVKENK